jgi:hypothetical protein
VFIPFAGGVLIFLGLMWRLLGFLWDSRGDRTRDQERILE